MGFFNFFKKNNEKEKPDKEEFPKELDETAPKKISEERKKQISAKLLEGSQDVLKKIKSERKNEDEEKIKFKDLEGALTSINDKKFLYVFNNFRANRKDFVIKNFSNMNFKSNSEVIDFLKEQVISFFNGIYMDLKDRLSDLRKKGKDVSFVEFKFLSLPLKIKLLNADFSEKNLGRVMNLISYIDKNLKIIESELEKELKEKEIKKKQKQNKTSKKLLPKSGVSLKSSQSKSNQTKKPANAKLSQLSSKPIQKKVSNDQNTASKPPAKKSSIKNNSS
ncbi:hypothetical protein GF386_05800 [Candidatus Pacearchaeota archaeon]|nr:hypothetical protein [Candidatus Pacearchaeota archaeon]MBD3283607.1 hypothetical protein [Candidatus Pacearchaeota archaeon]